MREPELSLKRAAEICQAAEAANVQLQTLTAQTSADVYTVKKKDFMVQKTGKPVKVLTKKKQATSCKRCGQKHESAPKKYPAYGQICFKCKGKNHFASQCFSKKRHTVEDSGSDTDSEGYLIQEVTDSSNNNEWISTVQVNGSLIPLKVNILSLSDYKGLASRPKLTKKSVLLRAYNGNKIPTSGVCRVKVTSQDKVVSAIFVVVPMDTQSILGLKTCEQLGLVKRVNLINRDKMVPSHQLAKKYADVFKGIGCLPVTYSIKLAGDVKPVVSPASTTGTTAETEDKVTGTSGAGSEN